SKTRTFPSSPPDATRRPSADSARACTFSSGPAQFTAFCGSPGFHTLTAAFVPAPREQLLGLLHVPDLYAGRAEKRPDGQLRPVRRKGKAVQVISRQG